MYTSNYSNESGVVLWAQMQEEKRKIRNQLFELRVYSKNKLIISQTLIIKMFPKQNSATLLTFAFIAIMFLLAECMPSGRPPSNEQPKQQQQPPKWGNHHKTSESDKQEIAKAKQAVENQTDPKHHLYFSSGAHTSIDTSKDDHSRHRGVGPSARMSGRLN